MRDGKPRRRVPRPAGRRNLSAVADAAGITAEYRVTKYEKGDCCDRIWLERREVRDRRCPRCGFDGRINGHYRRKVWHVPFRGGAQLALMLDQSLSDELRVAYELYQDLRLIHLAGKEGWWAGMPSELDRWRSFCRQSGVPEMARLAATVNRNKEGILNSYRYGRTNAVAEGINNSILPAA